MVGNLQFLGQMELRGLIEIFSYPEEENAEELLEAIALDQLYQLPVLLWPLIILVSEAEYGELFESFQPSMSRLELLSKIIVLLSGAQEIMLFPSLE